MSDPTTVTQPAPTAPVAPAAPVAAPVAPTSTTSSAVASPAAPTILEQATQLSDPAPAAPAAPEAAKPTAPAPQEYELELADDSPLTQAELDEIAGMAGKYNLSKEEAVKLISSREAAYKAGVSKFETSHNEKIAKAYEQISTAPEFSEANKAESLQAMSRAIKKFGDAELTALMKTPEVGNSLPIARFLIKLGKQIAPDTIEGKGSAGAAPAGGETEALQKMYPEFWSNK